MAKYLDALACPRGVHKSKDRLVALNWTLLLSHSQLIEGLMCPRIFASRTWPQLSSIDSKQHCTNEVKLDGGTLCVKKKGKKKEKTQASIHALALVLAALHQNVAVGKTSPISQMLCCLVW